MLPTTLWCLLLSCVLGFWCASRWSRVIVCQQVPFDGFLRIRQAILDAVKAWGTAALRLPGFQGGKAWLCSALVPALRFAVVLPLVFGS